MVKADDEDTCDPHSMSACSNQGDENPALNKATTSGGKNLEDTKKRKEKRKGILINDKDAAQIDRLKTLAKTSKDKSKEHEEKKKFHQHRGGASTKAMKEVNQRLDRIEKYL